MCGNCTPLTAEPIGYASPPANTELLSGDYTKMEDEVFVKGYNETRCRVFQEHPEIDQSRHSKKHVRKREPDRRSVDELIAQLFADLPSPSLSRESSLASEDTQDSSSLVCSGSLPSSPIDMAATTAVAQTPRKPTGSVSSIGTNVLETPLDFSFLNIVELTELETEEPRALLGKNAPRNEEGKYKCRCLKLNNNQIAEVKGLMVTVDKILLDASVLSWIDLSFNEMARIDPIFCDFPSLQILYLHGNQIGDIKEVDKLCGISNLKKLCLHGNPIETTKNYRWYVLSTLPQLISLDMSGITKADRVTASTWKSTNPTKRKKKRAGEE